MPSTVNNNTATTSTTQHPNTLWNLVAVPVIATDGEPITLFLPSAWTDDLTAVLDDDVLTVELSQAVTSTGTRSALIGWFTSCLLRDRGINAFSPTDRAGALIGLISRVRNLTDHASEDDLGVTVRRIANTPSRDIFHLLS